LTAANAASTRPSFILLDETLLDGSDFPASIAGNCEEIAQHRPELKSASLLEANAEIWARLVPEILDRWEKGEIDGAAVSSEAWRRTAVWLNRRALPRGPNDPIPDAEIRSLADLQSLDAPGRTCPQ
jgi:hypothetical protein